MVSIQDTGEAGNLTMLIQVPLGLYLPGKLTIGVDGNSLSVLEFQRCDKAGCYVGTKLSKELLDSMIRGQKMQLTVQNQKRQPKIIPVSLMGFAKALQRIG